MSITKCTGLQNKTRVGFAHAHAATSVSASVILPHECKEDSLRKCQEVVYLSLWSLIVVANLLQALDR